MMKTLKRVAIGLVVLVVLVGCAGVVLFKFVQHHVASVMRPPHLAMQPEAASDMVYRTLDGEEQHLYANKGQVVFLNLWGTWCVPCIAEMPTIQKLYDHYRGDPQEKFLIVSRLDSPARVKLYARSNHFDLPFYVTKDNDIPDSMQLRQYPSTFIFAKDGTLVSKHVWAADWSDDSVIAFIDGLKRQ